MTEVSLEKRFKANQCISLINVLPRHQLMNLDLTWLSMAQLKRLGEELRKLYAEK